MAKGYALISEKHIKGNGEDFHLFIVKDIKKNDNKSFNIIINKEAECSETSKYTEFTTNVKNHSSVDFNDKTYDFYHFSDYSFYYFPNEDTARIVIASIIKRKACGTCVSTLYANKNN